MRNLTPVLLAAVLTAVSVRGAPGEPLKTNSVAFSWELGAPTEAIELYCLYFRTNVPVGMPLTNAAPGKAIAWTPTDTNGWSLLLTVPGTNNQVTVPRLSVPTAVFYVLTASNAVGESPFSNVAWVPAPPNHRDKNFRVTAVQ